MNELIHRANFRFSDLHTWLKDSESELAKCNELRILIQECITERESEQTYDEAGEDEKEVLAQAAISLKKQAKKEKTCEQNLQNHIGFSKQTFSTNPQTLLRKKSIDASSVLIKKVKQNMIDIRKMKAELEKILVSITPEQFSDLKLQEWDQFD